MSDRVSKDLRRLTFGERLFLWRRRRGFNQTVAAERCKIAQQDWSAAERGVADEATNRAISKKVAWGNEVALPPSGTLLIIARRRAGLGVAELSRRIGLSRVRLNILERRGDERLFAFWESEGFRFPGRRRAARPTRQAA